MIHICVGNLTIIGSDNGLLPGRRQAIIWTNAGILIIGPLRNKLQWNSNRNSNIFVQENAPENVVSEMASILSRPQCVKKKTVQVNISLSIFIFFLNSVMKCTFPLIDLNYENTIFITLVKTIKVVKILGIFYRIPHNLCIFHHAKYSKLILRNYQFWVNTCSHCSCHYVVRDKI